MRQARGGTVLLLLATVLIGGWAFLKMIEPANMLEVLRLMSLC